jgi:hypothetical protein
MEVYIRINFSTLNHMILEYYYLSFYAVLQRIAFMSAYVLSSLQI